MPQPFDLSSQLARENRKLDRCSLIQRKNSLYLRATLPKRKDPTVWGQNSFPLKLKALPENLKKAVELARRLDDQLLHDSFSWALWEAEALEKHHQGLAPNSVSVEEFRAGIEAVFEQKCPQEPQTWETSWGKKFKPAINLLSPLNGPCSQELLMDALASAPPSSRKTYASIFNAVIRKLRLDYSTEAISEAGAGYTRAELTPRDIPSDDELLSYWSKIKLPHWRWMFGIVMTYGIRPHEIINSKLRANGILDVPNTTKTGRRETWACPEEWLDELDLRRISMPTQTKNKVSGACNSYIRDQGVPIPLYAARHAYAIRLLNHGISADVGAKLMGHSVQLHNSTYRRWMNEKHMSALRERIGHKFRRDGGTD